MVQQKHDILKLMPLAPHRNFICILLAVSI